MARSNPRVLPGTMSGSMVLPQLRPVLMSRAHDSTKGNTDAWGLSHNPLVYERHGATGVMLFWMVYIATQDYDVVPAQGAT